MAGAFVVLEWDADLFDGASIDDLEFEPGEDENGAAYLVITWSFEPTMH